MATTIKGLIRSVFLFFGIIPFMMGWIGCERITDKPVVVNKPFIRILKAQTLKSQLLQTTINYMVYLPKDYDSSKTSYPVVYLLHGMGDNETAWYEGGNISYYVDLYSAETVPMIYVMPQGFNTYWVNKYNGDYPYMDMLVKEMVPAIDKKFRTIKDPQHRAVMGYSMGGYGALILPAKNPTVFKTGVILSMSYRTDQQYMKESQDGWNFQWGSVFGGVGSAGVARLTDYYKEYNPFYFFKNSGDLSLNGQNYFFDCGDDEENLSEPNNALHVLLRDLNIRHEYRVRNGAHDWNYWNNALPEALKYISLAVENIPYPENPAPVDVGAAVTADRTLLEYLDGSGLAFSVTVPANYSSATISYPVILVLHDRNVISQDEESQQMISLLSNNMKSNKVPASIIVEIPVQTEPISAWVLQQIVNQVRSKYRTFPDRNHTILLCNNKAGSIAYKLIPECAELFNAFLLFDANLPDDAVTNSPDLSYYLDISDKGINYKGYHSLFMSLRKNKINHEYRVRQGTPSHNSFLNGLDESAGFMKTHLIN